MRTTEDPAPAGAQATTPRAALPRFVLPSAFGAAVFLAPIRVDGAWTIPFSLITDALAALFGNALAPLLLGCMLLGAGGALLWPLLRRTALGRVRGLALLFGVHWLWGALRVLGALYALGLVLGVGPEVLRAPDTGETVFRDICMPVLLVYLASAYLMGLLTDYGLMEFVGTLVQRPFRWLFRLPGRAAVDALASFVSSSGVGVLITTRQYEQGIYTAREAAVICCSFSVVSLPFALLITRVAGVEASFLAWYGTVALACVLAAAVVARVGPVARKPERFHQGEGAALPDAPLDAGGSAFRAGVAAARRRAARGMAPGPYLAAATFRAVDLLLGLLAPIMAIATTASVLVFHTPVFDVLARPVALGLGFLGFPEAEAAGKGFIVGALDQFMPALVAQGLESQVARFVLAGLSVSQLIYFSEYGMLMLRSPLPVTVLDLLLTFLLRTLVVAPVLVAGALLLA